MKTDLVGKRVQWTFTDERGRRQVIGGIVTGDGPHGRIEVVVDGVIHHIQPAWVDVVTDACRHCGRLIVLAGDVWVDPFATGDDSAWSETCDAHDTFEAQHEPKHTR